MKFGPLTVARYSSFLIFMALVLLAYLGKFGFSSFSGVIGGVYFVLGFLEIRKTSESHGASFQIPLQVRNLAWVIIYVTAELSGFSGANYFGLLALLAFSNEAIDFMLSLPFRR